MSDGITWEYFCDEVCRFIKVLGLRTYSLQQWMDAWKGLLAVAIRVPDEYHKKVEQTMNMLIVDYERRVAYRLGLGPREMVKEKQ